VGSDENKGAEMNTLVERFDGVELLRPAGDFRWPHPTFSGFPECCGPGPVGSIGNTLVPESILGLHMGPVCFVHDWMWGHGPLTWAAFHYSNSVFLTNMLETNKQRGGFLPIRVARMPMIFARYIAVSSPVGAARFFARGAV
jgi:hypothetical protein